MSDKQNSAIDTTREFIREFAELNLKITEEVSKANLLSVNPELLRELRENAQTLKQLMII